MTILLLIHIVITVTLIVSILLNKGIGSDAGAAFGSASPKTMFSKQKSSLKGVRFNTLMAIGFLATSLTLAILAKDNTSNISKQLERTETFKVPALDEENPTTTP